MASTFVKMVNNIDRLKEPSTALQDFNDVSELDTKLRTKISLLKKFALNYFELNESN